MESPLVSWYPPFFQADLYMLKRWHNKLLSIGCCWKHHVVLNWIAVLRWECPVILSVFRVACDRLIPPCSATKQDVCMGLYQEKSSVFFSYRPVVLCLGYSAPLLKSDKGVLHLAIFINFLRHRGKWEVSARPVFQRWGEDGFNYLPRLFQSSVDNLCLNVCLDINFCRLLLRWKWLLFFCDPR